MKVKRFLSLLLSLALAVSLAAPAFAAEETEESAETGYMSWYEFKTQYIADRPIPEDFDAGAWYQESYAWDMDDMTKEEYMEWMELTEEEFRAWMWENYVWETELYDDEAEAAYDVYVVEYYEATHPGELEALSTEELLAWWGYTETLTPAQQYMKDWGLNDQEEVRPALLANWAIDRLEREEAHQAFLYYQEKYPQEWAEFDVDGWFSEEYSYYDSPEEYMENWGYSREEFVEAMFVEYASIYLWDWDDNGWENDYGEELSLVVNGESRYDVSLTAENGVTYADAETVNALLGTQYAESPVALRAAAEAAGWDVVWNSRRNQVVLLEREKLLTGVILPEEGWVEKDLSGIDRLGEKLRSANNLEPGQNYKTTGTVDITYTAFNSLDGDETYTAQLKMETLSRDSVTEMSLTMELADLLRLLPETALAEMKSEFPKSAGDLKTLLNGVKVNLIWNGETGQLYLNAPIVALVDPTPGVNADTWYDFDLSELLEKETTTAEALYQSLLEDSETSWWGADDAYSEWLTKKETVYALFGADAITEKNGTLTWKLDADRVVAALDLEDVDVNSLFKECKAELTVGDKGKFDLDLAIRPDSDGITAAIYSGYPYYYYSLLTGGLLSGMDFRVAAKASGDDRGGTESVELHWKNRFKLTVESQASRKTVKDGPRSAPPEGAAIVEI